MYQKPPLVANASAAIPGAGTTTIALVGAPGAGFRIRLVGVQICVNRAAGAVCDCTVNDSAVGIIVRAHGLNVAGASCLAPPIPEPGIPLNENSALNLLGTSTAGAGTFSATAYYYFDTV